MRKKQIYCSPRQQLFSDAESIQNEYVISNFNEMFLWFQVGYGLDFSKHLETEECQFRNIPHALTNEVGLKQNNIKTAFFIIMIKSMTVFFLFYILIKIILNFTSL